MKTILFFLAYGLTFLSAQSLSFSVSSSSGIYSLTCANHQLTLTASSNFSAPVNYTWISTISVTTGSSAVINSPGIYTVSAASGANITSHTLSIVVNTVIPISSGSTTFVVTSQTLVTFVAISPSINITHYIYTPGGGGTFAATSTTMTYFPGGPGLYVHCITDDVNGCSSCLYPINLYYTPGGVGTYQGLKENEFEKDHIFPNPSNGLYTLKFNGETKGEIEIYNSIGVLVKMYDPNKDGKMLDIREQLCGIYVIKIYDGEGRPRYLKLIKE